MTNTRHEFPIIGLFDSHVGKERVTSAEALHHRTLATWAYLYSIPAFFALRQRSEFVQGWEYAAKMGSTVTSGATAGAVGKAGVPAVGAWMMIPGRANEKTMNALPMVDCLYGAAILQMDQLGPVVLSVPANPANRYYSVVVLDSFLNNFAYIGPQWTGNMANHFLIAPPGWKGEVPPWINRAWEAPTNQLTVYNRVFVKADDSDIDDVRAWRTGIRFSLLSTWGESSARMPSIDTRPYVFNNLRTLADPFDYFTVVFDFIHENPSSPEDDGLIQLFRTAGIGAGVSFPREPHLRDAIAEGAKDAQDILNARISGGEFKNGWKVPDKDLGKAGPFILTRAVTQLNQIGSNVPQECIYIFGYRDEAGEVLDGSRGVYTLTFERESFPPVRSPGFWSLTMYRKSDNLLVENSANRFYIRTDTPGFQYNSDGSISIHMAAEKPAGIPDGNWLPAPKAPFLVGLRLYYPAEEALEFQWFPPAAKRVQSQTER